MTNFEEWNFDIFNLYQSTEGTPLYTVVYFVLKKYNLIDKFRINPQKLHSFLRKIETNYGNNPYHNSIHASDAVHVVNYLISTAGLVPYLTDIDILSMIIAACCHGNFF